MNKRACLTLFTIAALCSGRASGIDVKTRAENPAPVKTDEEPFRKKVWDGVLDAGTNNRYWTKLADIASDEERRWRLFTIIFGTVAFALPLIFRPDETWKKWAVRVLDLIALVAFCVSLVDMLHKSATYNDLSTAQKRWVSLESQWEDLHRERNNLTPDELTSRVQTLARIEADLNSSDPPHEVNHVLLQQAQREEWIYRGQDKWAADHPGWANEKN